MQGLMIQGTASDVGKSMVQTLLCRYFANQGYRVAPFKSQNMTTYLAEISNGTYISRAQALQAEAAKQAPVTEMNPIVLKIVKNQQAEVFLQGKSVRVVSGTEYREQFYEKGLEAIQTSLDFLEKHYDLLLAEGAGSPVELNLKEKELVNMKVAEMADLPVVLVADIDRGGVFASVIGTLTLLTEAERKRVKGIVINKFQGEIALFTAGKEWLEQETGLPILGILPFISHHIEPEDSLSEQNYFPPTKEFTGDKYEDILTKFAPYIDFDQIDTIIQTWKPS